MFNPGYVMVDCTGLNLNSSSEQTINGLYNRAKAAIASGKPCYACNCNMSGAPCTPCSVIAWEEESGIVVTGHVLRILIESDDGVTVTNLVAG